MTCMRVSHTSWSGFGAVFWSGLRLWSWESPKFADPELELQLRTDGVTGWEGGYNTNLRYREPTQTLNHSPI